VIKKHFPYLINTDRYEDALQEGIIALIHAINTFNENLGTQFSTYAYNIYKTMYKTNYSLKVLKLTHRRCVKYKYLLNIGYADEKIQNKLSISNKTLAVIRRLCENI